MKIPHGTQDKRMLWLVVLGGRGKRAKLAFLVVAHSSAGNKVADLVLQEVLISKCDLA